MGWQAPGLACKLKSRAASLANMRPGDFVFMEYALAGLVPPLSSFLTLLEYYGLELPLLSPNSIALVAIFVHLYEMYVGVRPSVRLFWRFFVLKAHARRSTAATTSSAGHHARYITPISLGRWERWREDWTLVQADVQARLALPVGGPTLDRTEWGKDPGLEPGFDPVLDRIQYLAKNGLTSLMVLHDFLSKHLVPLQDRSHRPAWMYTVVNDIMRLDRGPESSLGDTLLAASLKALTTDQTSAELVMPAAGCEPLRTNQATRTTLLAIMSTLDDVDIAPVQRGNQSRGVLIPGPDGPSGAAGGHGHGVISVGGDPAGRRSGAPAGGRGGAAGGSSAAAPSKGKRTHVIFDDNEVSSDEDEPLQKRSRQLSDARPVVVDEAAAVDKEAMDKRAAAKRAAEEAAAKRDAEERATEEAVMKAAATEAGGAAGGSPAPGQAPSAAGAKRAAAPSGSTLPAKRPYRDIWKPRFVQLFLPLFSLLCGFMLLLPFLPWSSPFGAATARLPQMRLSGRLRGRLLSASPRPSKESLRMWLSPMGSQRWRQSQCQRWYRWRLQRGGS
jgi:hypothetical protein